MKNNIELDHNHLNKYIAEDEQYAERGTVFYFYAPKGIGRSKLLTKTTVFLR